MQPYCRMRQQVRKKWKNKTTTFILFTFLWIIYQNYRIGRLFYTPATHWDSAIYEGAMANFNGTCEEAAGCCFHNRQSKECLSQILSMSSQGYLEFKSQSSREKNKICIHTRRQTVVTSNRSDPDLDCRWWKREDGTLYNNVSGGPLHYHLHYADADLIQVLNNCVCDNPKLGIKIGPWCGSDDCKWKKDNSLGCRFRNVITHRCLSDVIEEENNKKKRTSPKQCICHNADHGVYIINKARGSCHIPDCRWERKESGLFYNLDSNKELLDIAHLTKQSFLMATSPTCLCQDETFGLIIDDKCGDMACLWSYGSTAPKSSNLQLIREYPLLHGWIPTHTAAVLVIDVVNKFPIIPNGHHLSVEPYAPLFEFELPEIFLTGKIHSVQLIDAKSGEVLEALQLQWTRNRVYQNFNGFLANSYTNPTIMRPFTEDDRRSFAAMENVAKFLIRSASELVDRPLVTVIMAIYNRLGTAEQAISSITGQTYKNLELILVDDGSTDGTVEWCKSLDDGRIKVIALGENMGPSKARNVGLENAQGKYIMYLDSDNHWEPTYVEAMVGAFTRLPGADAVYSGQMIYFGSADKPFAVRFGSLNKSLLFNRNFIDMNVFCHTKSAYQRLGGFDEELKRFVDWDLILRYAQHAKMYSVPVLLSHYYRDKANNTITASAEWADQELKVKYRNAATDSGDAKQVNTWVLKQQIDLKPVQRKVTVVIPNYQSLPELIDNVNALSSFGFKDMLQIIVVDNNSLDYVKEALQQLADNNNNTIQVIFNERNYGFSYAVNQGILAANPDSDIMLLNSDAFVRKGAIEIMQEAAYTLDAVGLIVPQQILQGGTKTLQVHVPYANPACSCDVNLSYHHNNIVNPMLFHDGEITELSFAPFFCVYLRRDVLHRAGLLDAEFGRHYRSDRIYSDVLRHIHGLKIYHVSKAEVVHKLQVSTEELAANSKDEFDLMFKQNQWDETDQITFGYRTAKWDI